MFRNLIRGGILKWLLFKVKVSCDLGKKIEEIGVLSSEFV